MIKRMIKKIDNFLFSKKSSRIILVCSISLLTLKLVLLPLFTAILYSGSFMTLVHECDTAMEASWYYKNNKTINKSELVQMLSCHEYDKVRKTLLLSGLPESYLSWLGLRSLDLYQRNPEEFVKLHRFIEK